MKQSSRETVEPRVRPHENRAVRKRTSGVDAVVQIGRFEMIEGVIAKGEIQRKPGIRITENWHEEFRDRVTTI